MFIDNIDCLTLMQKRQKLVQERKNCNLLVLNPITLNKVIQVILPD